MSEFRLGELLEERAGQGYKLYARHSNPVFVRMLKIIGFDRDWASAEGAYLIDRDGTRFLDMLGGFGMFNVGRNNPTVRRALEEALALDTPNLPQLGLSDLPGLLAEALCAVAPASTDRVLFTNSGAESIEAAIKLGRTATGRTRVVANLGGFHGLTLGALSINGSPVFRERFEPLLPGVAAIRNGAKEDIARSAGEDILCINVESEPELELLSRLAVEAGKTARISVRVNPDVDAGTHAKIATGKSENKFGVPIARARAVYARAAKLPGIEVTGTDVHIGSQDHRPQPDGNRVPHAVGTRADAARRRTYHLAYRFRRRARHSLSCRPRSPAGTISLCRDGQARDP